MGMERHGFIAHRTGLAGIIKVHVLLQYHAGCSLSTPASTRGLSAPSRCDRLIVSPLGVLVNPEPCLVSRCCTKRASTPYSLYAEASVSSLFPWTTFSRSTFATASACWIASDMLPSAGSSDDFWRNSFRICVCAAKRTGASPWGHGQKQWSDSRVGERTLEGEARGTHQVAVRSQCHGCRMSMRRGGVYLRLEIFQGT